MSTTKSKRVLTLPKGVRQAPSGNYTATVYIDGPLKYLGTYKKREDAAQAAMEARQVRDEERKRTGIRLPKGVIRNSAGRYEARIGCETIRFKLGTFDTEKEAGEAYLYAANVRKNTKNLKRMRKRELAAKNPKIES